MDFSFEKFWDRLSPSIAWSLVAVVGMVLWGPDWFREGLGLNEIISEYRKFLGIFFLLSIIRGLVPVWRAIGQKIIRLRGMYYGRKRLQSLTREERELLKRYTDNDTRTITLDVADGIASGLVSESIIYRSASIGRAAPGGAQFDHNIQPWAWEALQKNPHWLD